MGQPVVLNGSISGTSTSFAWPTATFLNDPLPDHPVATALNNIQFTLEVISGAECGVASDEMWVKVYNDIYVPTAFSPNGDGLNETWRIEGLLAVPNAGVHVYNRFGNIVFETTGYDRQWNGTYQGHPLPIGLICI